MSAYLIAAFILACVALTAPEFWYQLKRWREAVRDFTQDDGGIEE